MKTCAVPCCRHDSNRRPDLSFFNLPRDTYVRGEWLDVLGVKRGESTAYLKVCELHFRTKDFVAGKKQLKTHAVPVLKLGSGKAEPIDSEDEFLRCDSDSDPEILAVTESNFATSSFETKVKTEVGSPCDKNEIKQEPDDSEQETGRRPSRRAARVAAKKIYNTVRNYGISVEADDDDDEKQVPISPVPSRSANILRRQKWRACNNLKVQPVVIDLRMECHEELLSASQAEALLKAQLEYNLVMKSLRALKASNAKVIFLSEDLEKLDTNFPPCLQDESVSSSQHNPTPPPQSSSMIIESGEPVAKMKSPNIITVYPFRQDYSKNRPDNAKAVFPTKLSTTLSSSQFQPPYSPSPPLIIT